MKATLAFLSIGLMAGCLNGGLKNQCVVSSDCSSGRSCINASCQAVTTGGGASAPSCIQADGPLHAYTQKSELDALIIGKWVRCAGQPIVNIDHVGIEIATDGIYYLLVSDGNGGLVREGGFSGQGTWDSYQETARAVQLNFHPTPNSGVGGYPLFEDSPRKFQLEQYGGSSVYGIVE